MNPFAIAGVVLTLLGVSKLREKAALAESHSSERFEELQSEHEAAKERLAILQASYAEGATLREEISEAKRERDEALNRLKAFQTAEAAKDPARRPRRKRPASNSPASESSQPVATEGDEKETE